MDDQGEPAAIPIDQDEFLSLDAIREHLVAHGIPLPRWTFNTLNDGTVQLSCMRPNMKFVDVIFHLRRDLTMRASTPNGGNTLTIDEINCVSFDDFLQRIQDEYNRLPLRCKGDGYHNWHARNCPGFAPEDEDFDHDPTCKSCEHLGLFMDQYGDNMLDNFWVRNSTGQGVIMPEGMPNGDCHPM